MAITVTPKFTSPLGDDPDSFDAGEVTPSRWNQGSQITMATDRLLGRTTAGTGAVEELTRTQAAHAGAWVELSRQVVSSTVSAVDFTSVITSDYDEYELVMYNIGIDLPSNTYGGAVLRVSTNNGSSWVTTAGYNQYNADYDVGYLAAETRNGEKAHGVVRFWEPLNSSTRKTFAHFGSDINGTNFGTEGGSSYWPFMTTATSAFNAIRILAMNYTDNPDTFADITSGTLVFYGRKKS